MPKKILITGAAGFIGMHVCNELVKQKYNVVGIDNINSYYDTSLKYDRLAQLGIQKDKILYNQKNEGLPKFSFLEIDLSDAGSLMTLFSKEKFDIVINLAAQAGVRYSITNPRDYINSNIVGFFNLLEACRTYPVKHLIYASSSSVYGNNKTIPFSTDHKTDEPISLYAATKKSNELMAYTYAHLYRIPATGLRFFTVYGPWGRPDMAYFSFTKNIVEGQEIKLYNHGKLKRDFTYVDDIVKAIATLISKSPSNDENKVPHRVLNIGNQNPVDVITFVNILEELIGKRAIIKNMAMQPGDVMTTYADTSQILALTGIKPDTLLKDGLQKFVAWYKSYTKIK